MADYLELTTLLLPDLSETDRLSWAHDVENNSMEFHMDSWLKIQKNDLLSETVQKNFIRTIFQLQYGNYEGITGEILKKILAWTNGTVIFDEFPVVKNEFYQRAFALIGFQNFVAVPSTTQIYLLGSRFFPLASSLGVDVLVNVKMHFREYCQLDILEIDCALFTAAVRQNSTVIATRTLENWIGLFMAKSQPVNDFLSTTDVTELLTNDGQYKLLRVMLDLYEALVSGSIWKNLNAGFCFHESLNDVSSQNFIEAEQSPDRVYLKKLARVPDITVWLEDSEEIGKWLQVQTVDFVKGLFGVLISKANLDDNKQLDHIFVIISVAKTVHSFLNDILSFDESTSQFHWNSELLK